MIRITRTILIDEDEIQEVFIHTSGPGGQNVNKVATGVQLRFDITQSRSLPDDVRKRLVRLAGRRITANGVLIIKARQFRTQERNRRDAIGRLIDLIRKAAIRPKYRHKTSPTAASKKRRLDIKHRRGEIKRLRRSVSHHEQ